MYAVMNTVHFILSVHKYNTLDEDIMMLISYVGVSCFTIRFAAHTKKLAVVYGKLSDFKTFGRPPHIEKFNKMMNRITPFFISYEFLTVNMISFSNIFFIQTCKQYNERTGLTDVCGMVGRMWLPFNYDFFPLKPLVFSYELYASIMAYFISGCINWIIFEAVAHVNFRFRHLQQTFVELLSIKDPTERRKQFNMAIEYHCAIIEVSEMMSSCFKPCCMVHLILTAPVVGISGYRLVTSTTYCDVSIFASYIFCTLLVCYAGQRLQDTSSDLADILYNCEWHEYEKQLQLDMSLVILRARHPSYLNAGPLGNMGYATIVLLGKTAYSYLTLLNQTI